MNEQTNTLTFSAYSAVAKAFDGGIPWEVDKTWAALGLCEESGEVAGKLKKIYRDQGGHFSQSDFEDIAKELGDVLWYVNAVALRFGYSLEKIARMNLSKLQARADNGTLHGSGDNR